MARDPRHKARGGARGALQLLQEAMPCHARCRVQRWGEDLALCTCRRAVRAVGTPSYCACSTCAPTVACFHLQHQPPLPSLLHSQGG